MYYAPTIEEMQLDGGVACLDFINSACDEDGLVVERLHEYGDLLTLAERVKLLDRPTVRSLHLRAGKNKTEAHRVLTRAKENRLLLSRVFLAVAAKKPSGLDEKILLKLNRELREASSRKTFRVSGKELVEGWQTKPDDLSLPLDGFLISAYDLLKSGKQKYIKKCAACAWLFLDKSKGHRRKWCDMQTCGSSAKSKRYYQKKKKG